MSLIVKEVYAPTQNCLVYIGRLEGKINDKNKVFLGKIADLPKLKPGKRYNVRVRGSDPDGNRYVPLQCKGRTDGQGTLLIEDKYAPVLDESRDQEADNPHQPLTPRPAVLGLVINNILRGKW
jgi:hypothetical protein